MAGQKKRLKQYAMNKNKNSFTESIRRIRRDRTFRVVRGGVLNQWELVTLIRLASQKLTEKLYNVKPNEEYRKIGQRILNYLTGWHERVERLEEIEELPAWTPDVRFCFWDEVSQFVRKQKKDCAYHRIEVEVLQDDELLQLIGESCNQLINRWLVHTKTDKLYHQIGNEVQKFISA